MKRSSVYTTIDELPEVIGPGDYVVEGEKIEVREAISKIIVVKALELLSRYGGEGWA